MKKQKANKFLARQAGFSLIELLLVIVILGVLMTLGYQSFALSQKRARDAQRKSDLKQTQKALELYKQDQTPWAYPSTIDGLTALASPVPYVKETLADPLPASWNWPDYSYARDATDNLKYTVFACLENLNDVDRDADDGQGGDLCTVKGVSYSMTEP